MTLRFLCSHRREEVIGLERATDGHLLTSVTTGKIIPRITLIVMMLSSSVFALDLQFAGVIGNSGDIHTTIGRTGGGVVVDARGRIFCGGGDRILVLNRDGRRLWEYALPQPDWVLGGQEFVVVGDQLYFIAGKPTDYAFNEWDLRPDSFLVAPNICRVRMLPDVTAEVVVTPDKLAWESPFENGYLTLAASGDNLYLGYRPEGKAYVVAQVAPTGTLTRLFEHPNAVWMSLDEAGQFYLGWTTGVVKVDRRGQPVLGFQPAVPPPAGANVPSALNGKVMLTHNAIWDSGRYGFVARFDRQYHRAPGTVVNWQLLLHRVNQICDAPDGQYYIQSNDAVYLAALVDGQLKLRRRFGSLPEVAALVVTRQGYVGVGLTQCAMVWFDFEKSDPAAAPLKSYWPALSQGWYDGELAMMAYASAQKQIHLNRYRAEPFIDSDPFDARPQTNDLQVAAATPVGGFVFALEHSGQGLWRAIGGEPTRLTRLGAVTNWLPDNATSLTALGPGTLGLAGSGKVVALRVGVDGGLTRLWELTGVGTESFGRSLFVAASGGLLLVADTDHNRVLLFRVEPAGATLAAQLNDTLKRPTLIALEGARAVVYDSGNQRVVKLRIR